MSDTNRPSLTIIDGGQNTTDAVRIHVRKALEAERAYVDAGERKIAEFEATGGRVVDGGQVHGDTWEILDWRTGERLAYGTDGIEGYDRTTKELDPDGKWWHVDHIKEDVSYPGVDPTEGVPATLAAALEDWVTSGDVEEVAEISGWPVEEVERVTR